MKNKKEKTVSVRLNDKQAKKIIAGDTGIKFIDDYIQKLTEAVHS